MIEHEKNKKTESQLIKEKDNEIEKLKKKIKELEKELMAGKPIRFDD